MPARSLGQTWPEGDLACMDQNACQARVEGLVARAGSRAWMVKTLRELEARVRDLETSVGVLQQMHVFPPAATGVRHRAAPLEAASPLVRSAEERDWDESRGADA